MVRRPSASGLLRLLYVHDGDDPLRRDAGDLAAGSFALLLSNDIKNGVILLLWGLLVVSSIDNVIKPMFISEGSKIHMLLVFIGLFGGLYAWGVHRRLRRPAASVAGYVSA